MREVFGADRIAICGGLDMDFGDRCRQSAGMRPQLAPRHRPECAVVFLGEMPYTEFIGNIEDLALFGNQQDLVKALHKAGTPVVGVYLGGRPRTFAETDAVLDALVMAYLPGDYGARAIADVLSGAFNPSGRLPFTWPRHASAHLTHDRKHTESIHDSSKTDAFHPLYPFGHGLSYSTSTPRASLW